MRRIKKGIAVALSLVLALSLTACGNCLSEWSFIHTAVGYEGEETY